jgi:tRNA dimethylallyltransferase
MTNILISVLGPTATGKTTLAVRLALHFNGEIISADSRQVYRGMDIGTGKDLSEYFVNGKQIPFHLIDIADPEEEFNLYRFKKKFIESYLEIKSRNCLPFLTGGTGMYLSAILQDYKLKEGETDPEKIQLLNSLSDKDLEIKLLSLKPQHNKTDLVSRDRMLKAIIAVSGDEEISFPVKSCVIGVRFERDEIKKRITARLNQRLKSGMVEEVENLLKTGITPGKLLFFGLEYKYIALYLTGKIRYNDMYQKLNSSIHSFAKRQMTWFRKMEKEGVLINWVEQGNYDQSVEIIENFLRNEQG